MDSILYVPAPVWVQAVFVCLFILFAISLLYWVSREYKANREFISRINRENSEHIDKMEERWKGWLSDQNARECNSLSKVTESLEKLATKIDTHDDQAKTILGIVTQIHEDTNTKLRRRKSDSTLVKE
jgi:tRNA C32,U32 (ribose-2'-O)-methylase TrmJ